MFSGLDPLCGPFLLYWHPPHVHQGCFGHHCHYEIDGQVPVSALPCSIYKCDTSIGIYCFINFRDSLEQCTVSFQKLQTINCCVDGNFLQILLHFLVFPNHRTPQTTSKGVLEFSLLHFIPCWNFKLKRGRFEAEPTTNQAKLAHFHLRQPHFSEHPNVPYFTTFSA
jgi:hypothetical protein